MTVNNVWKRCLKAREDLKGPLSVRKGSGTREAEGVGRRGEGARGTGTAMKEGGRADGMKGSERDGGEGVDGCVCGREARMERAQSFSVLGLGSLSPSGFARSFWETSRPALVHWPLSLGS